METIETPSWTELDNRLNLSSERDKDGDASPNEEDTSRKNTPYPDHADDPDPLPLNSSKTRYVQQMEELN